jgi:benzodiazapine receptor
MSASAGLKQAIAVGAPPIAAAVAGNAFIGKDSMRWFRGLRTPRMQVPMSAFGLVGATYYVDLGIVLYRADRNDDRRVRRRALLVLAGNELWNVAFFGRRSPRSGFLGVLVFLGPLLALQRAVTSDRPSLVALTPYTLWVILYDVPWTYRLWQLNRSRAGLAVM